MQNLARDEAGNVWELDAQGNPMRLVTPAASGQGRVFSLPQNPKEAREEARANEDQRLQREAAERADRAAERADEAAQRQAAAAERAATAAAQPTDAQQKAKENADAKLRAAKAIQRQLADIRGIYDRSFRGAGPYQSVREMLPTKDAERFKAIARAMRADLKPLIRGPGEGTFTEGDQALLDQLIPDPRHFDAYNEQTFSELESRVNETLKQFDQNTASSDQRADNEVPDPTNNAGVKPLAPGELMDRSMAIDGPRAEEQTTAASGERRTIRDARLSAEIDALINAGAWNIANERLRKNNFPIITPAEKLAIEKWRKANPGKKYYGANLSREEDLSLFQQAAGSDTGAFLAHMANNATAGIPAAVAGPEGQGALDAMAANSPNAAGLGGVTGSVTGMMGAEAAVAARAPAALARYAPRIADTLYGGLFGFNQAREGEGGAGALTGAGAGLVGGFVGERAMRGAGHVFQGVTDPAVQYLRGVGVPLTAGQTLGNTGRVGQSVKKIEDALTSLPLVGNIVDARRMEGIEGFNRAAFDTAAQPVGGGVAETGPGGIDQLRQVIRQAYDNALTPARIDASEPALLADLAATRAAAARIPDVNGARGAADAALTARIIGAIDPVSGDIPGRNFQEAYRGLARTGRERAAGDYGHEIGQVMRQGQDALAGALERQNPGAFTAFRAANSTNRNANILAEAVNSAKSAEGQLFTPAQLNRADATSARRLTGPLASAAGDRPFHGLATAGQAALPSRIPDSGTWTRTLVGGGATGVLGGGGYVVGGQEGASTGTGLGLGAMLTLALGGSRPAQRALTAALADRPDWAGRFGQLLLENARFGGSAGAGASTALVTAP